MTVPVYNKLILLIFGTFGKAQKLGIEQRKILVFAKLTVHIHMRIAETVKTLKFNIAEPQ